MNDELPALFAQSRPHPAPVELRARVLGAVSQELARRTAPRWERVIELAVAASFVLGVGLNVWQQRAEQAWQTRVFGPLPVSREISDVAEAVASVTDAQTGRQFREDLSKSRRRRAAETAQHEQYERLLHDFTNPDAEAKL